MQSGGNSLKVGFELPLRKIIFLSFVKKVLKVDCLEKLVHGWVGLRVNGLKSQLKQIG